MNSTTVSAGDVLESVWAHIAYILAIVAICLSLPDEAYSHAGDHAFVLLGAIGAWRYGWGLLHFARSIYYRKVDYPRLRAAAEAAAAGRPKPCAYLMVTSFRIDAATTSRVYRATFEAAKAAPGKAVVVASIVEMADQRLIKQLYAQIISPEDDVDLVLVRIAGTGKRDALAFGFRAIAVRDPKPTDLVAVIDGDTVVPRDLVARCAPFFLLHENVGALTTDELCEVEARQIFREWWSLRFAQRQILMCSMGLSRRVLTLTGRMSMFRADLVCDPAFIRHVEVDYIDHWRLGRFKFLTGDDKSSWFSLLKNGYEMLYLPDVTITTIEQPPSDSFIESAGMLMTRWFGNMLRTNGRAIALGPRKIGLFTWWAILDQRLSMWTCLTGVAFAILGTIFLTPFTLVFYAIWILASRYVMSLMMFSVRDRMSIAYPFLLYFNQIFGSIVKVYVFFRLDKQKWTRQKTSNSRQIVGWPQRLVAYSSVYMHVFSLSVFAVLIAFIMGIADMPNHWSLIGQVF